MASAAAAVVPTQSYSAPTKKTQKLTTTLDPTAPLTTILTQPAFYAGFASLAPIYLAHINPRDFIPKRHVGTRINGIRAERYLVIPFTTIAILFCHTADAIMQGRQVHAHAVGLGTAMLGGFGCLAHYHISMWYVAFGFAYIGYGLVHHRNSLRVLTDRAPLARWSDFGEIWRDWRFRRSERQRLAALRAERRKRLAQLGQ